MTRRILFAGWAGWLGMTIMAACTQQTAATSARICTPGNFVFCRCKDRSEGTKLCNAEGEGFAPCEGCMSGSPDNTIGEPEPGPEEPIPTEDAAVPEPEKDAAPPVIDAGPPVGDRPKAGELFITEIMYDPSGNEPTDEWFEVFSIATKTVTLNGMTLKDGASRVHVLGATPPMKLAPSQHMLLVRNKPAAVAAGLPAASILGEYGTGDSDTGGILLTNAATGALAFLDGANEIVRVPYGSFAFVQAAPGGTSIQLKVPNVAQAKLATGWCLSPTVWIGQPAIKNPKDKGSPGAVSNCP